MVTRVDTGGVHRIEHTLTLLQEKMKETIFCVVTSFLKAHIRYGQLAQESAWCYL